MSEYAGGFNVSCFGGSDGSIDLTVSGGCYDYTFDWSNGATTEDVSGLAAGTYTVTVSESNGTSTTLSFTLTEPTLLTVNAGANQTVYFGYPDSACADLSATAGGGVAPYTYAWSTGETTQGINVCPESTMTYSVTITDANGCEVTDEVQVCSIDVRSRDKKGKVKNGKVDVCHIPKGNPGNAHTISISVNAVATHLSKHGDQLGACGTYRGCDDGSSKTSITKVSNTSGVILESFPNPFNGELTIMVSTSEESEGTVKIYDVNGKFIKIVLDGKFIANEKYGTEFVPGTLPTGLYLVRFETTLGTSIQRVVYSK